MSQSPIIPTVRGRLLALAAAVGLAGCVSTAAAADTAGIDFFEHAVRPLLADKCYSCHSAGAKKIKGSLRLDTYAGMIGGGESGKPAVVPGKPESSQIITAVHRSTEDLAMPPKEADKLSNQEQADLEKWVAMGAPHPEANGAVAAPVVDRAALMAKGREFWSFKPLAEVAVPAAGAGWADSDIDRFIAAGHKDKGLTPTPDADRRTLIRRATYDLTGLPPTPEESDAFVADQAPDAYARLVDRLLASPRYGEQWGRHWLDVARYADTAGDSADYPVPQAWRYRDWVISAFNRDLPYDHFIRAQIAGDLLPAGDDEERRGNLVATGFIALAKRFSVAPEREKQLTIEDTIDTLGHAVLGLSLNCARCHDHKFDPIPTTDYYALYGIFDSTRYPFAGSEENHRPFDLVRLVSEEEEAKATGGKAAEIRAEQEHLQALWKERDGGKRARRKAAEKARLADHGDGKELKPEEQAALAEQAKKDAEAHAAEDGKRRDDGAIKHEIEETQKRHQGLVDNLPDYLQAYAFAVGEMEQPHDVQVQKRGDLSKLGDQVRRGFPTVLGGQKVAAGTTGSGRLELAGWLSEPSNPLTARVMVNRLWHWHFGRGLVATTNDFGTRGAAPVNPALLDWLAKRFIAEGWSVKRLQREIMLSRTYRQGWSGDEHNRTIDPDNTLCWRFDRRRLSAEEIRDSMLAVSGRLDLSSAGPHPFPPLKDWGYSQHVQFFAVYPSSHRAVYVMQQRLRKHPFFELFDGADTSFSTGVRASASTPLQSLFLMNDRFVFDQAQAIAERAPGDAAEQVANVYRNVLGRAASADEVQVASTYLARFQAEAGAAGMDAKAGVASLARALLASNEFMFLE